MAKNTPIAVVGMAGVFPGASDLDTFWHTIENRISAIDDVPDGRWIISPENVVSSSGDPDTAFTKRAGLIRDFTFDPTGFAVSHDLLVQLDPMYQLVLTAGREALSGCVLSENSRKRTGVILAAIALPTDASTLFTRQILGKALETELFGNDILKTISPLSRTQCLAGRVTSLPASILARALNLGGGTYTLDAACSSSLYSIKLACDELHSGRADVMVSGGVSRPESLFTQTGFTQLTALSPTGICAPFDKNANGLVVGEGAGIIILKRLDDALRDGDTVHALIHGAGLSNDIGGNLLAPDTEGQVRAMSLAYESAGWSPYDVDHIECHGTGTPVGDSIELKSLRTLWGDTGWSKSQCAIGSVKSMIGHLLTGAGIAGTIKTILALKNRTLPPSLNFTEPAEGSPLEEGPFRVQTRAESWEPNGRTPRRAAMSAFGFGGINAHVLVEEWHPESTSLVSVPAEIRSEKTIPVAITGLGTYFSGAETLGDFQTTVFNGTCLTDKQYTPKRLEKTGVIAEKHMGGMSLPSGNFMETLSVEIGEFHIPPNEISEILPQHLMMLKASAQAMKDAGIPEREDKPRMGTAIGMGFDYEATNFNIRWNLDNSVEEWISDHKLNLSGTEKKEWLATLKEALHPPLNSSRTTGALGGIIASRVAKEFRLGGPSFIVSCEDASGIKALEIGMRSIRNNETDTFLAGAVDLPGEIRNIVASQNLRPFSASGNVKPFDRNADGVLPADGAAAVVLKRLDRAIEDGDRIYAVINGIGGASEGGIDSPVPAETAYRTSLERAFNDSGITPDSISYIEAHGSGVPAEDTLEASELNHFFSDVPALTAAIGSLPASVGHAGAVAGLASVVKTSLALYHEIVPPLPSYTASNDLFDENGPFHIPAVPHYWMRDSVNGPRRACVASMTTDGNVSHVVLSQPDTPDGNGSAEIKTIERLNPLGNPAKGLFIADGNTTEEILAKLDTLKESAGSCSTDIHSLACQWNRNNPSNKDSALCLTLIAGDLKTLLYWIDEGKKAVSDGDNKQFSGPDGISFTTTPVGSEAGVSLVYPGSGNHYAGMGRAIGTSWPELLRHLDSETDKLRSQLRPHSFYPFGSSWENGWEHRCLDSLNSNPWETIIGQVSHGVLVTDLIRYLAIRPSAVLSYSLGESAAFFGTRIWPERDEMFSRMEKTDLFTTRLSGECTSLKEAWNIPETDDIDWRVACINRPEAEVKPVVAEFSYARLLIVNTPDECVIGGLTSDIEAIIDRLGCDPVYLNGVITVHCDAAGPAAEAYRNLHLLKTDTPKEIRVYGCHSSKPYEINRENAADSVLAQAVEGFDFPLTINNAYNDGIRVFIETGPAASCSRMINTILKNKKHIAISACVKGEDDYLTALKLTGTLLTERIPVSTDLFYGEGRMKALPADGKSRSGTSINCSIGGLPVTLPGLPEALPETFVPDFSEPVQQAEIRTHPEAITPQPVPKPPENNTIDIAAQASDTTLSPDSPVKPYADMIEPFTRTIEETAMAHNRFLEFSESMSRSFADAINFQNSLIEKALSSDDPNLISSLKIDSPFVCDTSLPPVAPMDTVPDINAAHEPAPSMTVNTETFSPETLSPIPVEKKLRPEPAFSRDMCMEFAIGSLGKVLGPEFAVVDSYDVRVRLPDEPLMLVDRILTVEGEKGSLKSGKVVTEHDVLPGAWYLDGDRCPVCISIEAGQADLFLCSYLGIDLAVKGKRSYRLLDAVAKFHSGLPKPGDTIRYEIEIDRFINQGDTYLFFFHFNGYLGNRHIISMRNGCAGFFTEQEVKDSGGIVLTPEETAPVPGNKTPLWKDLVPFFDTNTTYSLTDNQVDALRRGDAETAFGNQFKGKQISSSLSIPGGRMKLVDRVLSIDPGGGRYGLGSIRAQADIRPDAWFLTCHFVDDMVMPGTLMYECCMHTLRIFTMRMGWISNREDICCEPVPEIDSVLKCRGPVTVETKHVYYVVEIREIGYGPEPYVIADAHMYAHDQHIVMFRDMSMKLSGISQSEIESNWGIQE